MTIPLKDHGSTHRLEIIILSDVFVCTCGFRDSWLASWVHQSISVVPSIISPPEKQTGMLSGQKYSLPHCENGYEAIR